MSQIEESPRTITKAQWSLVALIVAFTLASILYRVLIYKHLEHSSAMFVGIPAVLAIVLALAPKAETATGGILKGITLALLIPAPLLGEGYVCILFAAPLFFVVGILVGLAVDRGRNRKATLSCAALILLPMCLEGVAPELTVNRAQTVTVTRVVSASTDAVEASLALSPRINTILPAYLRIGFPRPLEAHGDGLSIGATRTIHFSGAEGDPPGDLVMRVAEQRPGYVRFETISDGSKLTQWVRWDSSQVSWKRIDATHTEVTWKINFARQVDPAWYFVLWERAAVHEGAKYLIEANATPAGTLR
jgi:hypothetical protein